MVDLCAVATRTANRVATDVFSANKTHRGRRPHFRMLRHCQFLFLRLWKLRLFYVVHRSSLHQQNMYWMHDGLLSDHLNTFSINFDFLFNFKQTVFIQVSKFMYLKCSLTVMGTSQIFSASHLELFLNMSVLIPNNACASSEDLLF